MMTSERYKGYLLSLCVALAAVFLPIAAAEPSSELTAEVAPTYVGTLKGMAMDEYGLATAGVTVTLEPVNTPDTVGLADPVVQLTEEDGQFLFSDVPYGTYIAEAKKSGLTTVQVLSVLVFADQTTEFDFGMLPDAGEEAKIVRYHMSTENLEITPFGAALSKEFLSRVPQGRHCVFEPAPEAEEESTLDVNTSTDDATD